MSAKGGSARGGKNKKIVFAFFAIMAIFLVFAAKEANAAMCGANNEGVCVDLNCPVTTTKISGTCSASSQICCKPTIDPASAPSSSPASTPPPATADTSSSGGGGQTIDFINPIKASSMAELLGNVLNALLGVVAFISIIFIIIGAVMYMLSSGNEQMVERAKKTITGAAAGLAIAAAAPTFLKEIKNILGGASGANADDIVNKAYTLKDIAINVLNFLLAVTGIIAIIGLVIGAIFYLTSYGDEERMEKGKKIFVAAVIGIAIAFAAMVIVRQVANLIAAQ